MGDGWWRENRQLLRLLDLGECGVERLMGLQGIFFSKFVDWTLDTLFYFVLWKVGFDYNILF